MKHKKATRLEVLDAAWWNTLSAFHQSLMKDTKCKNAGQTIKAGRSCDRMRVVAVYH